MTLYSCILFYSFMSGIDPALTQAVIKVESNGNPYALSPDKMDGGLMQIRIKYVPETKLQLFQSCTNVQRGVLILKNAKDKCKLCIDKTWVIGYNLGIAGAKRIKHPKKFPYYKKIMGAMK